MSAYTYGSLTVGLPEHIEITDRAVNLPWDKAKHLARPRKGIERICREVADIMDANPDVAVPDFSVDALRDASAKSESIKKHVIELESVLKTFKQQKLLYNNAAYELIRRVYSQVKSQAQFNARVEDNFSPLWDYFGRKPTQKAEDATNSSEDAAGI